MAKQPTIFVKGSIGNVIFYERNGRPYARSKPGSVKQTANMKQRSLNFGIAARAGKTLRVQLAPLLPFPKDRKMQSRFSGALSQWLGTQPINELLPQPAVAALHGYNFNEACRLAERFKAPVHVSLPSTGQVTIDIAAFVPTQVLAAPAHTAYAELTVITTACRLADAMPVATEIFSRRIDYNNIQQPAQQLQYTIAAQPGTLVLVAASISFWRSNGKKEMREGDLPAVVLGAAYW